MKSSPTCATISIGATETERWPIDAGNIGLFCDLAGTLVKIDETRQLADRRAGNISD